MVVKILFIIFIIILIFCTLGFITEWKFIVGKKDDYKEHEHSNKHKEMKYKILQQANKQVLDFPIHFRTVIEKRKDEFSEIEIKY